MKREDVEAGGGENLVRYRKEPSGCPVCGKVTRVGAGPGTQLTFFYGKLQSSTQCTWGRGWGRFRVEWILGCPEPQGPLTRCSGHLLSCRRGGSPVKELSLVSAQLGFSADAAIVRMLQCREPGACGGGGWTF